MEMWMTNDDDLATLGEREGDAGFSRRNFLVRAGQVAGALTLAAPGLSSFLRTAAYASTLGTAGGGMAGASAPGAPLDLDAITSGMRWRMLGPFRGGRVAAACGASGRPNEFYFGSVNGGVWKSVDAGRVWAPVFDSQPVASIGAIATAPSAPDTVYVGSGESSLRDSAGYGNGMYKSVDAGKSWTHIGLADTQHIGKIAVDPRNPNVVFVAAIGHLYAPSAERGVFRTTDGGKSWQKVLFKSEDVGAIEVVIDPTNSQVVYAGLWNTRRPPWFTYAPTNGPGGGIFKSTDGGSTWKQLTNGLPAEGIGRTGIAVAPTNSQRVYAVVDCLVPDPKAPAPAAPANARAGQAAPGQGGFFRSDDGGASWTKLSGDQALWGRGWYFEKVTVDPKNADIVYVPNVAVNRSKDGGKTWIALRGSPGGDDYHQAWVSPDDSNTMIVASDQGAIVTRNATADDAKTVTWSSWLNQPTAQMYHISVDYRFPYWVTGAQQDSGAVGVRSRGKFAEISVRDWEPVGAGGESGYTAGDALNPGILYGGTGNAYNLETNTPIAGTATPQPPANETMRADWTQPLVFSKADPKALYYASQYLFKTTDGAKSWTRISEDLTRPEGSPPRTLDAAAAAQVDRNGKRGVIYTIAPSPVKAPTVWLGTDDGLIHLTTDDGAHWQNVTPGAISAWSRVTMIEASHFDVSSAYASVDRHQLQDFEPYVYRTRDMGKSWQKITNGLPAGVYVHVVKEDPMRRGLLLAGTERGAFISMDDGDSWQPLQLNLPVTSVRDFVIHSNDLIVGTHGRGIWVIDDISALRQLNDTVLKSEAHLFKPADTINYAQGGDNGTPLQKDEPQAQNPANGAYIDYYLKSAPSTPVTLQILDAGGKVVQTFSTDPSQQSAAGGRRRGGGGGAGGGIPNVSPLWVTPPEPFSGAPGLHRAVWTPISPVSAAPGVDGGPRRGGGEPLFGTFTAKLMVNGQSYTQSFSVKRMNP
jgi:photosystem II stability/assembly factor-like uncharacterized protein